MMGLEDDPASFWVSVYIFRGELAVKGGIIILSTSSTWNLFVLSWGEKNNP